MATRAPKQWCLTKTESVNSYENWRQNLIYTLSLDVNFAPFLISGINWTKKSTANGTRGQTDDGEDIPAGSRHTAIQKVTILNLMLGQIANYCPVISRNTIVKSSTSLASIWQAIRSHYGFQATGAHFIDFADIKHEVDERPEDLYQRLVAFMEDSMLRAEGGISHHGVVPAEDEEISPSLENYVVLTWLRLINEGLPRLVKQRYGTELRSRTLASIKPEISQALDSLLDEVRSSADIKVFRSVSMPSANKPFRNYGQTPHSKSASSSNRPRSPPQCPLCRSAKRPDNHYLSRCTFLPEQDRRFMIKARQVYAHDLSDDNYDRFDQFDAVEHTSDFNIDTPNQGKLPQLDSLSTRRVQVKLSPYMSVFSDHFAVRITLDSGSEANLIKLSTATYLGATILKSTQVAFQADGMSSLEVRGETRIAFSRDRRTFLFEGLVVEELDVDVLGGVPFLSLNDISIRTAKHQVILSDGTIYPYCSSAETSSPHAVRRTCAQIVRAPSTSTTIWPGEYMEVEVPEEVSGESSFALEPRIDSSVCRKSKELWPSPAVVHNVGGKLRIPNCTNQPKLLHRGEHFCQVLSVSAPNSSPGDLPPAQPSRLSTTPPASVTVKLDPDHILPPSIVASFRSTITKYEEVFSSDISGYNGHYGQYSAVVNMGPVQPPQRKGRVPQYARNKLVELQQKFDELEMAGVFKKPEDAGVVAEYINPSFLVKKSNGGFRLVTAFADVGRYSKPQPALMPDVDSTLRLIARWSFIIVSDLTSAFYQIPLSKDSYKYCGVVTPFRGVRVYVRSAMGMPGSETALEELMSRILGDLLQDGVVAKLADDLYCGGNSPDELLHNWQRVLEAFHKCGMRLSPTKTVIAPKTTTILGWIWSEGCIHASPHRIATLSTCTSPTTVRGLRSFIGAFKVLSRVIPHCANFMAPLDNAVAGGQSQDKLVWTDALRAAFHAAQHSLTSNKTITLPHPSDLLWIVTDGAVKDPGIGATLYAVRDNKVLLSGFYSAKLRPRQVSWIPCEIEALSIAAAVKHFSPYIIQSHQQVCILTDSKPCVQSFEKLCRGEFSSSPRVSTFLATVSRYQASLRHLSGCSNVPSDFASRNAPECNNPDCQICSFIVQTEESVVRHVSTQDVISGHVKLPFTSRSAWGVTQLECPDLRRTHAHLKQGTRPSKKLTNIRDIKRYIQMSTIAKDGLLVVPRKDNLAPTRECIVVPRQVLDGLLTALHIKLDHPSSHQLKCVFHRFFYALDMDKAIEEVVRSCHQCTSLKSIPHTISSQSTSDPPDAVGVSFAADVIKREKQLILVVRETVTSYTVSQIITNECHDTLRESLINLCVAIRPLDGPMSVIRTDPAPGFQALVGDKFLHQQRLVIEIGRIKNVNKNPVAEKAIQELEQEILRLEPTGGSISPLKLSIAVSNLNTRIRNRGLSAREMLTQRDQFTNQQLPVSDRNLILEQHAKRVTNHPYSEKAKAPLGKISNIPNIDVGDLVYLYIDRNKVRARDRYLVVSTEGDWCNIRKFVGSQLRRTSYRVKMSECYKVECGIRYDPHVLTRTQVNEEDEAETEVDYLSTSQPPPLPTIPPELSLPGVINVPHNISTSVEVNPVPVDVSSIVPTIATAPYESVTMIPSTISNTRPQRSRNPPEKLKDYVLF